MGFMEHKRRSLRIEPLEDRRLLAVVINEIHYNPEDNTSREEFIELYNTGPAAVNLSGWKFTDGIEYTFPSGTQIPAGGYVVVAQDPATMLSKFGVATLGPFSGGLSGDGENVELSNAQGVVIDEVDYGVSFPWPVAADGNGASMELINPSLDNNLGSSWRASFTPPMFPTEPEPIPPANGSALNDLVHRWSFNGNLEDSVGNADGILVDPQGIATWSSTRLNVSANSGQSSDQSPFTSGAYVDLPNSIISTLGGSATFEWWGTVSRNRTWAEIFSFGRSSGGENSSVGAVNQEYITLIPQSGDNTLRLTHREGGTQTESSVNGAVPETGDEYHFTVVWDDAANVQRLYVNGALVGSSSLAIDLVDIEDVNNWLGRSQWADPLFDGYHNEFRIYNRALTTTEVASSYADGPDAMVTGPAINVFAASSTDINIGQSTTLSWDVTGASALSINQGIGDVPGTGQIVVSPTETTTYTITASNFEGVTSKSVTINVSQPRATPGGQNNVFATNAAPNIRQVEHTIDPTSSTPVKITAKVTDPQGVASVELQYQVVLAGQYLPARLPVPVADLMADGSLRPTANPEYFDPANWTTVAMTDNGSGGDTAAGDSVFSITLGAQAHRTLVRYRIVVTDTLGVSAMVPYEDDASLNFAYFVYDGVPEYRNNTNQVVGDAEAMASLPVYHFLTRSEDMEAVLAYDNADEIPQGLDARSVYNWSGTMVYNGQVYDNITYRLRGANGRYLTDGKRSMRFRFNDGSWFEPIDNEGNPYPEKWKTLTTGKGFDNRQTLTYALNEAMTMQLSNLMGLPAPETHWFQFRVIDSAAEAPDQWRGDFWGINFALEDYDKRFLDAHGLEEGNLYKLINQSNNALRQQDYQAPNSVSDGSDHDYIEYVLSRASTDIEYRVNLEKYFVFRAISEAVRHYDYWPTANKNMTYYFEPDFLPENDNLGKLWLLMWDTDATWGPTWNEGQDVVYDDIFFNFNTAYRDSLIKPLYYNTIRELRDLIWQPDQIKGMLDELVSKILPLEAADRARWQNAPADAGNYNGLGGAGYTSLTNLVNDMMNFAFNGGNWPGGSVGAGGRAAYLDGLLTGSGEEALIPLKPTITYVGAPNMPADQLAFQTTAFADPQGAGTFAAMEWRIAEVTPVAAGLDTNTIFVDEFSAEWESGVLTSFGATINPPASAVEAGKTYRARVRMQDNTGRWGHWSDAVEFVAAEASAVPTIRIVEFNYHPAPNPNVVDEEDMEFIEIQNIGAQTVDVSGVQIVDFSSTPYVIPNGTSLAPGARLVVARNPAILQQVYGTISNLMPAGYGSANLSNGGETIRLLTAGGVEIQKIEYTDDPPWPTSADGGGYSLVIVDPLGNSSDGTNWQASGVLGGTPGTGEQQFSPGDFDQDGDVDGRDFMLWQRNPSVGNLSDWKQNYGTETLSAVSSQLSASQSDSGLESVVGGSNSGVVVVLPELVELVPAYISDTIVSDPGDAAPGLGVITPARENVSLLQAVRGNDEIYDRYVEEVDRVMESFVPVQRFGVREFGEMVARRTLKSRPLEPLVLLDLPK
jgi:hypothetical protein